MPPILSPVAKMGIGIFHQLPTAQSWQWTDAAGLPRAIIYKQTRAHKALKLCKFLFCGLPEIQWTKIPTLKESKGAMLWDSGTSDHQISGGPQKKICMISQNYVKPSIRPIPIHFPAWFVLDPMEHIWKNGWEPQIESQICDLVNWI